MTSKHVYIYTIGCQMNVYDSQQMTAFMAPHGYTPTDDIRKADLIIANTCTIRAKAEQKAFSFLGRLATAKARRPELIIAIGGCVAQQEGERILRRVPHVDIVFGTHAVCRLPDMVRQVAERRCRIVDVAQSEGIDAHEFLPAAAAPSPVNAFVTIMRGCDNYCTYCVVPHVRGREASRSADEIIKEIEGLVVDGVREVTLLGQNVNSYGQKEGWSDFADLLARVDAVQGLERIRFTTSHPKDLSENLMEAFRDLPKLCAHIHLPVQSGSDRILRRMNRKYTRAEYLQRVARLRAYCPEIAISSDIIVGFPGETEEDFAATQSLIDAVGYDSLFVFMYSDRPNAAAARFKDKVAEAVKHDRLQLVLSQQEAHTRRAHEALLGASLAVLVEGRSKLDNGNGADPTTASVQWMGRTSGNKIVNFSFPPEVSDGIPSKGHNLTGLSVDVIIKKALAHSLWGEMMPHT
jgi:tRNA-2-methylthio-N6-dimethylallyladenosine synthase